MGLPLPGGGPQGSFRLPSQSSSQDFLDDVQFFVWQGLMTGQAFSFYLLDFSHLSVRILDTSSILISAMKIRRASTNA